MGRLYKFVFTGGPCSGKSTSIGRIRNFLENRGYTVICIPEAATISFSNGIIYKPESAYFFQLAISSISSSNERNFTKYATEIAKTSARDVVVLMDRAVIDGGAYCSKEEFDKILTNVEMPTKKELLKTYDAVFFLVTAAKGAEDFYGLEGVRKESLELACETDDNSFEVWKDHHNIHVFDNHNKTFEIKIKDVVSSVCSELGIPHTQKIPRRFLMSAQEYDIPAHIRVTRRTIEKTFIRPTSCDAKDDPMKMYTFIRSSSSKNTFYCVQKTVKFENNQRIETKETITRRQYRSLASFSDPKHAVVRQKKTFFSLGSSHYEICDYETPSPGLRLLSVYRSDVDTIKTSIAGDDEDVLPSFLKVKIEVTDDVGYTSHFLSRVDQSLHYEFGENGSGATKVVYRLMKKKQTNLN